MFAALFFEVASFAAAPWVMPVLDEIDDADSPEEIETGLGRLIWKQQVRIALAHVPCVLCCLFAITERGVGFCLEKA